MEQIEVEAIANEVYLLLIKDDLAAVVNHLLKLTSVQCFLVGLMLDKEVTMYMAHKNITELFRICLEDLK